MPVLVFVLAVVAAVAVKLVMILIPPLLVTVLAVLVVVSLRVPPIAVSVFFSQAVAVQIEESALESPDRLSNSDSGG